MSRKEVRLTSAEVTQIVVEFVAKQAGMALPVHHEARWGMVQGQLELRLTIGPAPNVRKLESARKTTRRLGKERKCT